MRKLYTEETEKGFGRKLRLWRAVSALCAAAGIALCVLFCLRRTTADTSLMLRRCIATFTLAGWAVIFLMKNFVIASRRQLKHFSLMTSSEAELLEGVLEPGGERFTLDKGVPCFPYRMDCGGKTRLLNLNAAFSRERGGLRGRVRVAAVHGFITAWEVPDEEN